MAVAWFLLVLLTSPAMSMIEATNPSTTLYQLLKNYNTKAAKEAFIKSGRTIYNFGMFVFLRTFDETEGKATVEVIQRRVWRDTTLQSSGVNFPSNWTTIYVPHNWVWMPDNFLPSEKDPNCNQYIRLPNWLISVCTSTVEVECVKSEKYRYPKDRFTCQVKSKLSNSVRKQDIQCVNNTRAFYRPGPFTPRIIYPPLPCRTLLNEKIFNMLHERFPKDWKTTGILERIVNRRLLLEFTLERFHPHFFKSDVLLGAITGIVAVSLSLFGLSPSQRLEICSIGLVIVLGHFEFTTEIPVVYSGRNVNLVSLSIALICIQCIAVVWSIAVCNFHLICARLGALPPFLRVLFDRFIPPVTEDEGEDQQNEKQWKSAVLVMDHIVFAFLACALLIIFPITLL